jgi:hypothetical protein
MYPDLNSLPLLRRDNLLPGESLQSLIERLTLRNYYSHSGFIEWICCRQTDSHHSRDKIVRPKTDQTFEKLALLTKISAEELFAASDHRFASILNLPEQTKSIMMPDENHRERVTRATGQRHIRSSSAAQFCTLCLSDSAYHRLSWIPVASTICLKHKCLLVVQCPQCSKKVSVTEIIAAKCKACNFDLREAPYVSVADDVLGILSQQVIQYWLSIAPKPPLSTCRKLPNCLPNSIYHLLDIFRICLLICQKQWSKLPTSFSDLPLLIQEKLSIRSRMTPYTSYYLFRAAFTGIWNWPKGFYDFLDAYSHRNEKARQSSKFIPRFGSLGCRLWKTRKLQQFEFVQQSLLDYVLIRGLPLPHPMIYEFNNVSWFIERTGLLNKQRAAKELGISEDLLHRYFPHGSLAECLWLQSTHSFPMFERKKVLEIKTQLDVGLPVNEVCRWLGIKKKHVFQLIKLGCLTVDSKPNDTDWINWIINQQSVVAFFDKISHRLLVYEDFTFDLVSWKKAADFLKISGGRFLQCVADGILPGYKYHAAPIQTVNDIFFPYSMLIESYEIVHPSTT